VVEAGEVNFNNITLNSFYFADGLITNLYSWGLIVGNTKYFNNPSAPAVIDCKLPSGDPRDCHAFSFIDTRITNFNDLRWYRKERLYYLQQ